MGFDIDGCTWRQSGGSAIDGGTLSAVRREVQLRLDALLPLSGERDLVTFAMRESALAPGKRMRPLLLIMAGRDLGADASGLVDLACAVEMVHAASLVLDDMPCMDNASLRRGKPTIHLLFGEDVAVLAAVGLLSRAFGVVATAPGIAPQVRNELVAVLATAIGPQGLVKGQYQDLHDGTHARSCEDIAVTNELKTCVLFGAALDMAALAAGASPRIRQSLAAFASHLGHAFQIRDDLLDMQGDDGLKDMGKDEGKSTLIAVLGEDEARRCLQTHVDGASARLNEIYGENAPISRFVSSMFEDAVRRPCVSLAA